MVRHVRCSCTRVVLSLLGLSLGLVMVRIVLAWVRCGREVESKASRHLEAVHGGQLVNNMEFIDKKGREDFVEVLREKPRVSLSSSLREEHPQPQIKLAWPDKREEEGVEGGDVGIGDPLPPGLVVGPSNLSSVKASLKDPGFAQKIRDLEDRRQDLYLSILTKRGQIVTGEGGGQTIVSYPQAPVKFPNNLKKNISDWTEKEKVWLNISHFPWPNDPSCRKYSVTFARPHSIPVVGLASYPSSGNTWLRYLIEGITGHYTGSMYNDIVLRKKGFYGEGVPRDGGVVVTVKTHGHTTEKGAHVPRPKQVEYNHHKEVNHSAILVIRNPFNAIIGHRNLDTGGHTGLAKLDQFVGSGWQEFVEIKAQAWLNFYSDWLENNPSENILVLHYENIQQSLKHSLRKMAAFLGFQEDMGRIDCTLQFQTGHFKRKHQQDIRDNPYTDEQKEIIARSIMELDQKLRRYRKETLPLQKYEHYNFTTASKSLLSQPS